MHAQDLSLIARFREGDTTAARQIEAWVRKAASSYSQRLGEEWPDTVQEVLVELMSLLGGDRFRGESRLITYVWQVTNHACIKAMRRLARRSNTLPSTFEPAAPSEDSPAAALIRAERQKTLVRVLNLMPEECRSAWKSILQGKSYKEMSAELGISEGTLRVRVLRCRRKAAELLASMEKPALAVTSPRQMDPKE